MSLRNSEARHASKNPLVAKFFVATSAILISLYWWETRLSAPKAFYSTNPANSSSSLVSPSASPQDSTELIEVDGAGLSESQLLMLPPDDIRRKNYELKKRLDNVSKYTPIEYDYLFQRLGLSPDEKEKLVNLLVVKEMLLEQDSTIKDIWEGNSKLVTADLPPFGRAPARRGANVTVNFTDPNESNRLTQAVYGPVYDEIHTLLGDQRFQVFLDAMTTDSLWNSYGFIQDALSEAGLPPLTNQERQMLVVLMKDKYVENDLFRQFQISPEAIESATAFLSPAQIAVLKSLMNQWQGYYAAVATAVAAGKVAPAYKKK